jgi:hypothetical protein
MEYVFCYRKKFKIIINDCVGYRNPNIPLTKPIYFIEIAFSKSDFATTFLQVLNSISIPKFIHLSIPSLSQYCEDG